MHRIHARAAVFLLFAGALAPPAPAGAQPVVPIEPLAGASIVVVIPGLAGGTSRAELSGDLPLTLPFALSNPSCSAAGTATFAQVDGALQIDVAVSSLAGSVFSQPCFVGFSGQFDEEARITVPWVGDRVTPLVAQVQQRFSGTDNIRFTDWSGQLQGPAVSEVLTGQMPDAALRSSVSVRTQPLPLLRIVSLVPGDRPVYRASAAASVNGQADNGGGSLGAGGSFDASVRFVVMVPPRPARAPRAALAR